MLKDMMSDMINGFTITVSIAYAVLAVILIVVWNSAEPLTSTLCLAVVLFYTAASYRKVPEDQIGLKSLFGRPLFNVKSGLTFVPLFIMSLKLYYKTIRQFELPTDPEKIYRPKANETETTPENMRPATRVPFGPAVENAPENTMGWKINATDEDRRDDSKKVSLGPNQILSRDGNETILNNADESDPLNKRLTQEISSITRFKIVDPKKFVQKIGTLKEAERQLGDEVDAVFFRDLTMYSLAVVLANTDFFNQTLEKELGKLIGDDWGIELVSSKLKIVRISRGLNEAIQSKAEATATAAAVAITAGGEKERLKLEGEGHAEAELAVLTARAEGLMKIKETGVSADAALGSVTAERITDSPSDKVIISAGSGGFGDLLSAGLSIGETLKMNKSSQEEEEPSVSDEENQS